VWEARERMESRKCELDMGMVMDIDGKGTENMGGGGEKCLW
jgi:hypothetical protein